MKKMTDGSLEHPNRAREAVIEYFDKYEFEDTGMYKPDHFLAWLWVEGFKITKLEDNDI